jgi:putative transposase
MSERQACRVVKQPRGTQRYRPTQRDDEDALTQAIVTLASQYGRSGYRRITALLKRARWKVGKDRVERIWRREGLKVPQKQKPRGRLWLNDGSCVRLRPQHANHVWSYDFVSTKTHDGRTVRMLNLIVPLTEHIRDFLPILEAADDLAEIIRHFESMAGFSNDCCFQFVHFIPHIMRWTASSISLHLGQSAG